MTKAFHCMAVLINRQSDRHFAEEGAVSMDIFICKTREEASKQILEKAKQLNPKYDVLFHDVLELDMERLMKDWLDGKKTGHDYYKPLPSK